MSSLNRSEALAKLDRLDERLDVTGEQLKDEICQFIDERIDLMKQNVSRAQSLIHHGHGNPKLASTDGPHIELVLFREYANRRSFITLGPKVEMMVHQ